MVILYAARKELNVCSVINQNLNDANWDLNEANRNEVNLFDGS